MARKNPNRKRRFPNRVQPARAAPQPVAPKPAVVKAVETPPPTVIATAVSRSSRGRTKVRTSRMADRLAGVFNPEPTNAFDDVFPDEQQRERRDSVLSEAQQDETGQAKPLKVVKPDGVEMDPMAWWALEMARDGQDIWLFPYQPTRSINPPRPRTHAAGYDKYSQTLRIRFRNGRVYGYYHVPPAIWRDFRRTISPGRYINAVLNHYSYAPERDLDIPTGLT